jgi:hypothetical protein
MNEYPFLLWLGDHFITIIVVYTLWSHDYEKTRDNFHGGSFWWGIAFTLTINLVASLIKVVIING